MDSVSHIIIGAAIGEVALGKKIGRWGMLIGAIAKTFPDFDLVYTGLDDPKLYMCHHRGHTHSLIWESLYAIPLAYLCYLIFRKKVSFSQMLITWLACLYGHSILDWFTNYGTRLWLPFTNESYAINTIAIIDLVFTTPMLIFSIWSLFYSNKTDRRYNLNKLILGYCVAYLAIISVNKLYIDSTFSNSLKSQGISHTKFMSNPTIFNNILWYANAVSKDTLYVGEYGLLDKNKDIKWRAFPRQMELTENHPSQENVKLLNWFSRGYAICRQQGDTLKYYSVKFGQNNFTSSLIDETYAFHYTVYPKDGKWLFGMTEPVRNSENFKMALKALWYRMLGKK